MKSYSEFVSESFVGGLRKAGAAIKSGVSSNVKGGIRNIKQVKNNPKVAAQRAGRQAARVASNPNARSVGSGIVGAVKGFGKREPAKLTAHDAKGDGLILLRSMILPSALDTIFWVTTKISFDSSMIS